MHPPNQKDLLAQDSDGSYPMSVAMEESKKSTHKFKVGATIIKRNRILETFKNNKMKLEFKEIKNAVAKSYLEFTDVVPKTELKQYQAEFDQVSKQILESENLDELINILDGLGFNKASESYGSIFDSILKD